MFCPKSPVSIRIPGRHRNQSRVAWADPDQIKADVQAARLQADVVIVFLHGGIEITDVINNISPNQRLEAYTAIDAVPPW